MRIMRDFDGKIVLVTGASTGLGAALAVGAATRGAQAVIINYAKSQAEAEATAAAVRAAGAEAVLAQGDVSDDAACRAVAAAAQPYGRIDALANNAGVTKFAPAHGDLDALAREDFERIFASTSLRRSKCCARPAAARSRRARERVNDSSSPASPASARPWPTRRQRAH